MFCPKCGRPDQSPETFCRQCGTFLPDLLKPAKKENTPEEHIKVNTVLSLMTVITCFTLAILLYSVLGFRQQTPILVYVTTGLLIAMGAWHIQSFIRIRKLKKQWSLRSPNQTSDENSGIGGSTIELMLEPADFNDPVPVSVTENTTRNLSKHEMCSPKA
ncbi:MAG: hypothetical protein KA956_13390 [Pyrinomonadaceae bacterium]|nr:hypothetical protein [Acidobacteriota bacterium]MBK7935460.1 hypothetical protein [Acidobacteriota bacterium]MBP7377462.1 hypothetical protein [Pyrinomonadaceae bacterium]